MAESVSFAVSFLTEIGRFFTDKEAEKESIKS